MAMAMAKTWVNQQGKVVIAAIKDADADRQRKRMAYRCNGSLCSWGLTTSQVVFLCLLFKEPPANGRVLPQ